MSKITPQKIIHLLEEVVAEHGPQTIAQCRYAVYDPDVKPHCIAGQVVYKIGGLEALGKLTEGPPISSRKNCEVLLDLGLTNGAVSVLRVAQGAQDYGENWGVALTRAKKFLEECKETFEEYDE